MTARSGGVKGHQSQSISSFAIGYVGRNETLAVVHGFRAAQTLGNTYRFPQTQLVNDKDVKLSGKRQVESFRFDGSCCGKATSFDDSQLPDGG